MNMHISNDQADQPEPFPEVVTLPGIPVLDNESLPSHTVAVSELNKLTAELDTALKQFHQDATVFEPFTKRLQEDIDGRFSAILQRAFSHLVLIAADELEKGSPTTAQLNYIQALGSCSFETIADSVFYDQLNPEARLFMSNTYGSLGARILTLTIDTEQAVPGCKAAATLLTSTRVLLDSNELSNFPVPKDQLQESSDCVAVILTSILLTESYSEDLDIDDIDCLIELAFDIAAKTRNPELAETLMASYTVYEEFLEEMLDSPEEENPYEVSQDTLDSAAPTFEEYQSLRLMSLKCLHACALCVEDESYLEFFKDILDQDKNAPEYSEALLGYARLRPDLAEPYFIEAIQEACEGNPAAVQSLFTLIDTSTATGELLDAFVAVGEDAAFETIAMLHPFIAKLTTLDAEGLTEYGFDPYVEITLDGMSEDSAGISLRQRTAELFDDFVVTVEHILAED